MHDQLLRTAPALALVLLGTACQTPATVQDDAFTPPVDGGRDAAAAPDTGPPLDAFVGIDAFVASDAAGPDAFVPSDAFVGVDAFVPPDAFVGVDAFVPPDAWTAPVRPGAHDLVITEIQAAPAGYADDSLAEWVEVHNPSASVTYDLNGCIFSDKPADDDHTIAHELLIPPGGYIVLSSSAFTVATHGFVSDEVYGTTGTGLSGTGDAPCIKCGGVVVDVADYNAASFADPDAMEGHTLQLDPGSLDAVMNDDGANWCFSTHVFVTSLGMDDMGTPRAANEACP